jgi:hypothetical protein
VQIYHVVPARPRSARKFKTIYYHAFLQILPLSESCADSNQLKTMHNQAARVLKSLVSILIACEISFARQSNTKSDVSQITFAQ